MLIKATVSERMHGSPCPPCFRHRPQLKTSKLSRAALVVICTQAEIARALVGVLVKYGTYAGRVEALAPLDFV